MEVIASLFNCLAAAIVAGAAIYGIKDWKREFRGRRQIELAEDTLALFYEAEKAIIAIRSPLSYGYEGTTRKQGEKETPEQKEVRDKAFVVVERFKEREQVFNKLLSTRYRFMAQIGKTEAEPFEEIRSIVNKIFQAARWLGYLWSKDTSHNTPERQEKHFETIRKYEAIFWEGVPEEDEISKRLEEAVSDMEQTCNNIIVTGQQKQ